MKALEVKNLKKRYDSFYLNNVSFDLDQGYILGYIGQNGAGKSTTINAIMNFIKKDGGEVRVFGKKIEEDELAYKESIGYVCDECYYLDSMKCKDVEKAMATFYDTFDKDKFASYLSGWDIGMEIKVGSLSKGMKTKLMLASVLSRDTKILILDEPTSGLDPIFRSEILKILQEYIVDGKHSVLFSTHILSDIEKIADYVCFIMNGRLVLNDAADNVLESHYVIKGDMDDIGLIKDKLISYQTNKYGFNGLIKTGSGASIDGRFVLEKPDMEDIMIGYNNLEGKNDKVL